jgi:hypothetical protein
VVLYGHDEMAIFILHKPWSYMASSHSRSSRDYSVYLEQWFSALFYSLHLFLNNEPFVGTLSFDILTNKWQIKKLSPEHFRAPTGGHRTAIMNHGVQKSILAGLWHHFHLVYWMRQDSNPQPIDHESNLPTSRPDCHRPKNWIRIKYISPFWNSTNWT